MSELSLSSSTRSNARVYLAYGVFLIVVGLVGYLSNPEKAKTALMSGGVFGGAALMISVLLSRGHRWALKVGAVMTALLSVVFVWRSSASWSAVMAGESHKILAAALITAMLLASLLVVLKSWSAVKNQLR